MKRIVVISFIALGMTLGLNADGAGGCTPSGWCGGGTGGITGGASLISLVNICVYVLTK
jgi:hypothetical protein